MPVWVARNGGLVGTALNVNYIAIRPGDRRLPPEVQELLAATDDGVCRTTSGGQQWGKLAMPDPSGVEFSAPSVAAVIFDWVGYDPTDTAIIYARATYAAASHMWIYKSTDAGLTWVSRGVVAT